MARASHVDDADYLLADLVAAESWHFWFRARRRLVVWMIARVFPRLGSLLEVGCGTGPLLWDLRERFPGAVLAGCDILFDSLRYATARLPQSLGCGAPPMSSAVTDAAIVAPSCSPRRVQPGSKVLRCTSFFTATLPLMALHRFAGRDASFQPVSELQISRAANAIAELLLQPEWWLIKAGMSLPIGSSLMLVARATGCVTTQ